MHIITPRIAVEVLRVALLVLGFQIAGGPGTGPVTSIFAPHATTYVVVAVVLAVFAFGSGSSTDSKGEEEREENRGKPHDGEDLLDEYAVSG
jgi:hypothetical protein